jgi:hypothetical protein
MEALVGDDFYSHRSIAGQHLMRERYHNDI